MVIYKSEYGYLQNYDCKTVSKVLETVLQGWKT